MQGRSCSSRSTLRTAPIPGSEASVCRMNRSFCVGIISMGSPFYLSIALLQVLSSGSHLRAVELLAKSLINFLLYPARLRKDRTSISLHLWLQEFLDHLQLAILRGYLSSTNCIQDTCTCLRPLILAWFYLCLRCSPYSTDSTQQRTRTKLEYSYAV